MMLAGSRHFTLTEVRDASHSLTLAQLSALAVPISRTLGKLEQVRALLGDRPIRIISLARAPEHNEDVGGSSTSDHVNGLAADISVSGLSPEQVMVALRPYVRGLGIDQMIRGATSVHLGFGYRARGELLVALGNKRYAQWTPGATSGELPAVVVTAPGPTDPPAIGGTSKLALIIGAIIGTALWLFVNPTTH